VKLFSDCRKPISVEPLGQPHQRWPQRVLNRFGGTREILSARYRSLTVAAL